MSTELTGIKQFQLAKWRWAAAALAIMFVSMIPAAVTIAGSKNENAYQIPITKWSETYVAYCSSHGLAPQYQWLIPQVWLFSPDGHMVKVVTVDDDPELKQLTTSFQFPKRAKALEKQPTAEQFREMVAQTDPDASFHKKSADRWLAVLFLSNSAGCKHCAPFENGIAQLADRAPGKLDVVKVILTH